MGRYRFAVMLMALVTVFLVSGNQASASSSYYSDRSRSGIANASCADCHGAASTCNGCHAHGVHSSSAKSDLKLTAATDKASYHAGDPVSVTVNGGYRTGWVRVILYNGDPTQGGTELARSTGPNGTGGGPAFPITLQVQAPTTPGTYTFYASWYGNQYDKSGGFFGAKWRPDPNNQGHGEEIVAVNAFTVVSTTPPPTPAISVTDSVAPTTDLQVPFGSVTAGSSANQTVTVTNSGTASLVMGAVGSTNPLAAPFSITNNTCSNQTIAPAATCTMTIAFAPVAAGAFSDSFNIPSNDPAKASVIVNISGTGAAAPTATISVTDSVAPTTDLQVPFGSVTAGSSANQTVTVTNSGNAALTRSE
ncbi:MAG: choice-of-anchor D domain-containing protein, partial [Nitrospirae bacterium]|nr:choice-of-anchor D domain-containing protein [Nitrospirota bacterium]